MRTILSLLLAITAVVMATTANALPDPTEHTISFTWPETFADGTAIPTPGAVGAEVYTCQVAVPVDIVVECDLVANQQRLTQPVDGVIGFTYPSTYEAGSTAYVTYRTYYEGLFSAFAALQETTLSTPELPDPGPFVVD